MKRLLIRGTAILAGTVVIIVAGWFVTTATRGKDSLVQAEQARGVSDDLPSRELKAVPVRVVRPTIEDFQRTTAQPAHVEPYELTDVFAKASGFVAVLHVDIGDRVKKDQVLAELRIPEMDQERLHKAAIVDEARAAIGQAQANLVAAQAVVLSAEANLEEASSKIAQYDAEVNFRRSEHSRFAQLAERGSVQQALVEEKLNWLRAAESALASTRAGVNSAKANLEVEKARVAQSEAGLKHSEARLRVAQADLHKTEILIDYAKILAPYDGLVSRRWVDTGDFVASAADSKSEPLLTVVRTDVLRIVSDIPESESSLIREGQRVTFVVDALKGREFTGSITRTAGVLDPKSRTLRVQVEYNSPETILRPGMFGMMTATLADRPESVMLATPCIQYSGNDAYVLCVSDGVAQKHPVKVGYSDGMRTEVLEGVAPTDEIISESRSPVRPGQRVEIVANR